MSKTKIFKFESLMRRTKIAVKRAKKGKNPFVFRQEDETHANLAKRHAQEERFRIYGLLAIAVSFLFLAVLMTSIISHGYSAFRKTEILLPINFDQAALGEDLESADYRELVKNSLTFAFPEAEGRTEKFSLYALVSKDASFVLKDMIRNDPNLLGSIKEVWLAASSDVDMFMKGRISAETASENRRLSDQQIGWINRLQSESRIKVSFNDIFFSQGDSREPEQAGILTSIIGSIFVITICIVIAFPIGVLSALYLEEFAPKNWITDLIEININNLAAVPSIIFGLLGLAIYLNLFGVERSSSLAGGLTLALLILPIIVISTRNSIKAVPPSIKDAAIALGASKVKVAFNHTILYAMPGIMTGVILGIARALGETAPLLMIGMVAFVADVPHSFMDPATTLPVQVYLWSDSPEIGFVEKTSAAILVLLTFLIFINSLAIYLRKKLEIRW